MARDVRAARAHTSYEVTMAIVIIQSRTAPLATTTTPICRSCYYYYYHYYYYGYHCYCLCSCHCSCCRNEGRCFHTAASTATAAAAAPVTIPATATVVISPTPSPPGRFLLPPPPPPCFFSADPTSKAAGRNPQGQGTLPGNSPSNPAMKLGWRRML